MAIKLRYFLCLILLIGLVSCASLSHQNMPEEGSVDLALVKNKCKHCHGLPHPKRHTSDEWSNLLVLMMDHMRERKITFTLQEMQQIKLYLQRNAR